MTGHRSVRRYGDEYHCSSCGKQWSVDDPDPPECKRESTAGRDAVESFVPFVSAEDCDPVNRPSHYTDGGIECIDAIKASMSTEAFLGFLKGNVQKYMWRYEKKVAPVEDLKKAQWYLSKLIEEQERS